MRKRTGFAILALGVGLLGWWAQANNAQRMETSIMNAAANAVASSVHGVVTTVSGRDIHLSGIANGAEEEAALLSALDAVPGRRIVTKDLTVLDTASPFTFDVAKDAGTLSATGYVPTEALRGELAATLADQAAGLTLAAGAPAGWDALAKAGVAALGPMNKGVMSLSGSGLKISGEVNGPDELAAMDAALAGLPDGFVTKDITLLDDGKPAAYEINYTASDGAILTGKLPKGLDAGAIATAMGLPALTNSATVGILGDIADAAPFAAFKDWMGKLESLKVAVGPQGRSVVATVQGGINSEEVQTALAAGLAGFDVGVTPVLPEGTNGQVRVNAASGLNERFMGGFWLPVPKINLTLADCQAEADKVLQSDTITFLTGSADLDPSAVRVINALASVMAVCAEQVSLKAVIGGHTDSSGDAAANLGLSQQRAVAVRRELIARGVPGAALKSVGYGATVPVADNATDEGKAKNRRTTIQWSN